MREIVIFKNGEDNHSPRNEKGFISYSVCWEPEEGKMMQCAMSDFMGIHKLFCLKNGKLLYYCKKVFILVSKFTSSVFLSTYVVNINFKVIFTPILNFIGVTRQV